MRVRDISDPNNTAPCASEIDLGVQKKPPVSSGPIRDLHFLCFIAMMNPILDSSLPLKMFLRINIIYPNLTKRSAIGAGNNTLVSHAHKKAFTFMGASILWRLGFSFKTQKQPPSHAKTRGRDRENSRLSILAG